MIITQQQIDSLVAALDVAAKYIAEEPNTKTFMSNAHIYDLAVTSIEEVLKEAVNGTPNAK